MKPLMADLGCGAGGASMGYHRAGFRVVGFDIKKQPRYPFQFIMMDMIEFLKQYGKRFDAIHVSPPCQKWSRSTPRANRKDFPDLITPVRELLEGLGKPYVIENVPLAPMENPLMLCGTMFPGLRVVRHRLFETKPEIYFPPAPCNHYLRTAKQGRQPDRENEFICVVGNFADPEYAKEAMNIDWMIKREMAQAIPPDYTEWIGKQLIEAV